MDESRNLVLCHHCDQLVSRSTRNRHENKRNREEVLRKSCQKSESSDTTDSDSEGRQHIDTTTADPQNCSPNQNEDTASKDTNEDFMESDGACSVDDNHLNDSNEFATDDDSGEEVWNDLVLKDLINDIENPRPLPAKEDDKHIVHSLLFWLLYFLLIWQTSCYISDNGMAWLLKFLSSWFKLLGVIVPSDTLAQIVTAFPGTLYMLRQFFHFDRDNFDKFVVCSKCHSLYEYNECLKTVNNRKVGRKCSGVRYSRGKRVECGAELVYKVQLSNGESCFYPTHYYCFNSIINSLEKLLGKKGFAEKCEEWRSRDIPVDKMVDVYDGKIWKDFLTFDGKDFLNSFRNYGFMLNFDFFQPMKRRKDYSVGVFYLVLLNLPRAERFKWENVIIIGIVPSLSKEPKDLNPFLKPAVKELQCLWKGIRLNSALSRFPLTFRAAVLAVSCDIPAARKLGGFKSHSAQRGCSRCLKFFPGGFGVKRDYSGFDRDKWEPRRNNKHRRLAKKIASIKAQSRRDHFCRDHGITHYSILLDLEYFDAIRFFTIDPMHNLFLGTAKAMFKIWVNNGMSSKDLQKIEDRIKTMEIPNDLGRLPANISANHGSYTAEQWKNWTLLYSLFCLKDILSDKEFKCWQSFGLACKYICQGVISEADLHIADGLFVKFCTEVETIYGKEAIKPNMHLHCHLKDILIDHGPVLSFWCFSFERYNGILGSIPTNKRSVELQLMRRFQLSRFFDGKTLPTLFKDELFHLYTLKNNDTSYEWLENSTWTERYALHNLAVASPIPSGNVWRNECGIFRPSNYKLSCLDKDDATLLLTVYNLMYRDITCTLKDLSQLIEKFGRITIGTTAFGSKMETRSIRSAMVLASWHSSDGTINFFSYPWYSEILFQPHYKRRRKAHSTYICLYEVVQRTGQL
ncbi:Hypothetical predicted protein [Paramuricea clavata]|uniref:Uncharacterized protein n=1 Tax=Paramuricea clavata TaxID=317549 RepID=A0A6S7JL11_PARCT|nr:Hypothetical predicted protein [Paramuricea clavata]